MITRTNMLHDWKVGRTVLKCAWATLKNPNPKPSEHKITNLTPRCVILDDHSKWCRIGQRTGQSYDGNFHGYIEIKLTSEEEERSHLLMLINRVDWDTIDIEILRSMTSILENQDVS